MRLVQSPISFQYPIEIWLKLTQPFRQTLLFNFVSRKKLWTIIRLNHNWLWFEMNVANTARLVQVMCSSEFLLLLQHSRSRGFLQDCKTRWNCCTLKAKGRFIIFQQLLHSFLYTPWFHSKVKTGCLHWILAGREKKWPHYDGITNDACAERGHGLLNHLSRK